MPQRVISADDHIDISHERVKTFLAAKYHDDYDQAVAAFARSMRSSVSAESNQRWREQQGLEVDPDAVPMINRRQHPANGRPGHTDPIERLRDMDTDGVDASSSYCEVSAFRYLYLIKNGWQESTRAFNTALADFASADPRRLIVSYQLPIHDVEVAVKEVQWAAAEGCKSLQIPVFPAELGLPDYWDRSYDPLWSAIQDAGLPVCCHIGLNTQLEGLAKRDPTPQKGVFVPMVALSAAEAFGMWVLTGVFERFPRLNVVFVEPGIGWVSWWLYIVDDMATRQGYEFPGLKELPSHYFRQNVYLTFIDEPDVIRHAHDRLGIRNVMWSSDYPHPVSSWPNSKPTIETLFSDVDPADRELVLSGNAARVWNL